MRGLSLSKQFMKNIYVETFTNGPGGWIGWDANGASPIEIQNGAAVSRSPWWVDCNHAPPGAGYLHILFALHTQHGPNFSPATLKAGGSNHYVLGKYPTDLTNAKITVTVRGDIQLRGAQMLLLAQGNTSKDVNSPNWVNQVLTAQPISVSKDWSEQNITLVPDPHQWTQLGSHRDRLGFYGESSINDLLKDVNGDIIFVLFPLDVKPNREVTGSIHDHWWDNRYDELDSTRLPEGAVMLDEVKIEFPY